MKCRFNQLKLRIARFNPALCVICHPSKHLCLVVVKPMFPLIGHSPNEQVTPDVYERLLREVVFDKIVRCFLFSGLVCHTANTISYPQTESNKNRHQSSLFLTKEKP